MKSTVACMLVLLLCASCGLAEANPEPVYEFAAGFDADAAVKGIYEGTISGDTHVWNMFLDWIKSQFEEPVRLTLSAAYSSIAPVFMIAMLRSSRTMRTGGGDGACFLLRLVLMLSFSDLADMALAACETCLRAASGFTSAAAPGIAAVLTSMGLTGTSALVSPAAALAGGIAEDIFLKYGLVLCKAALCLAIVGSLSEAIDLNRFVNLMKKIINWGSGLVTAIFTALIALQGSVVEALDGVGVRTAKFAVDSAAPVIGSGASDVWDSFVSGMMITKNALGISGIAALVAAGLRPVIICTTALLLLNALAALLELFGEKETARSAIQVGEICQMALSLATGALAIGIVLMGAAVGIGRGILG